MLNFAFDKIYKAAIYLRLSREDRAPSRYGSKPESDSISNQRMLIYDFLKKHPEIEVKSEYCDDGYTGANFERPQFQRMMEDVKSGRIDCIVVKDLSRFGREYIDSGHYLQKVFPQLGIRFIAVNDHYDNANPNAVDDDLVLPFKNMVNDAYCRDISIKVRTNLEAKRRSGQFVGNKTTYGYKRNPNDKNKLVVDPPAAQVVQSIFRWKIDGMSAGQIADKLNETGVPSPIEYKKATGSKQRSYFQKNGHARWYASTIFRILGDEIYTGTLLQGKSTSPNHKVKKRVKKDQSEWARTDNAHEAIIARAQFDLVQRLLKEDTRAPERSKEIYPLSGKICCADCGEAMVRRTARCGEHTYAYFVCSANKKDRERCSSHLIQEQLVYDTVLAVLQTHIAAALNMEAALDNVEALSWERRELERLETQIAAMEEQIRRNTRLKATAYGDYRQELLSREEYDAFKQEFDRKIQEANSAIAKLHADQDSVRGGMADQQSWLAQFRQYRNIRQITRNVVANLIDKVLIHADKIIEVRLLYQDQFQSIIEFLKGQEQGDDARCEGSRSGRAM